MKKILINLFVLVVGNLSVNAQANNAEAFANKIAQRMKDTLALSQVQKEQVFAINKQLYQQKQAAWQQYSHTDSLITFHVQRIEDMRDSLYKAVLTNDQFRVYRDKKRRLINNN
jgi:hypothetical protein